MTFIDHLKGASPETLFLEVAIGRHVITGDLAKSIVTGSSPTHVVKVQNLLGDALGRGWSGPEGIWYNGTNRDSSKYKFFPGIYSPSNADATQGIDSVFDQDTPHSGVAWIRVECPNGSEVGIPDFDTKNNPPNLLTGIYKCQIADIYNSSGAVSSADQFITNPADALSFGCIDIRKYPTSRIDWTSLAALRTACNVTEIPDYTSLPQGVGLTGKYYDGSAFNTFKSQRVDPVIQYDLSTGAPALDLTPTGFSVRYEGKIRFKYSETYTMTLIHNDSGQLWINDLVTPIINQASAGTHTATFAATADVWYDIKLEWTNAASDSQFTLQWNSTSQTLQVVPQDRLYPKAEAVTRFQTHIKFVGRTTFDDYLRSVLFTCNGGYQDVGGKLKFFCIEDLTPSYVFDETNIIKDSLKFYPRFTQQEILSLPNRFIASGRDLDSRYLEAFDPPVFYDLPDLQDQAGRVIEQIVDVGNSTRWQALKNLKHFANLKTTPMVAEFEGMPQTLPVLQGDVVTVTHSTPAWNELQCIVVEATDKSSGKDADNRIFKVYDWSANQKWLPKYLTGKTYRLNAADLVLSNNDPVASWSDNFALLGATTQSSASLKPLYKTGILASGTKPAVLFDNSNDAMLTPLSITATPFTIFLVYAHHSNTGGGHRMIQGDNSGAHNWLFGPWGGNHEYYDGNFRTSPPTAATDVFAIISIVADATNTSFYVNGTLVQTRSTGTTIPGVIGLGCQGGYAEPADAYLADLAFANVASSATERQKMEGFLAAEWFGSGSSNPLDASHPYKVYAPTR